MTDYLQKILALKKEHKISCLIPAYNEAKNIGRVLEVVQNFPAFDEILVIDDGSTDETAEIVNSYQKISLLRHQVNLGKTAAILNGIKNSSGDMIVMIDADLIGLSSENIAKMIYSVINHECDLAILDRAGDHSAVWGWTNCARFFGGERAFWRKDFDEINLPENSGYLLEIIMNQHYIGKKKKIKNIYCENLYTVHQYEKFGAIDGYKNYFNVAVKIVKKATVKGFIQQIKVIETDYPSPRRKVKIPQFRMPEFQAIQHYSERFGEYKDRLYSQYQDLRETVLRKF